MWMNVLPACISVYDVYAQYLWRLAEGVRSPGSEVADGCAPPVGAGNQTWFPKEQQMIETAEPPLQPLNFLIAITWVIPIKIQVSYTKKVTNFVCG